MIVVGAEFDGETAFESIPGGTSDNADCFVVVVQTTIDRVPEGDVRMELDSSTPSDVPRSIAFIFCVETLDYLEPEASAMWGVLTLRRR